jgi:hypothetical protein
VVVDQPVPLPQDRSAAVTIRTADGQIQSIPADQNEYAGGKTPGIYELGLSGESQRFAVNLADAESDTAPLNLEQLEQFGVKLASDRSRSERVDRMRQQRDTELEGRQKVWRWLLVGCLGVVILETWWAGRAAVAANKPVEEVA